MASSVSVSWEPDPEHSPERCLRVGPWEQLWVDDVPVKQYGLVDHVVKNAITNLAAGGRESVIKRKKER